MFQTMDPGGELVSLVVLRHEAGLQGQALDAGPNVQLDLS